MKKFLAFAVLLLLGFYVAWPAFSGYQINKALKANDAAALDRKIDFVSVRRSMRKPVLRQVEKRMAAVLASMGPMAAAFADKIPKDKIEGLIDASLADTVNAKEVGGIYARGGDIAGALQASIMRQIDKMGGIGALLGGGGGAVPAAGGANAGGGSIGGMKLPGGLGGLLANKQVRELAGQAAGQAGLDMSQLAGKLFPKAGNGAAASGKPGKPSSFGLSNIKSFGFAGPLGLKLGVAKDSAAKGPDVTAQMNFTGFDWKVTKLRPDLLDR